MEEKNTIYSNVGLNGVNAALLWLISFCKGYNENSILRRAVLWNYRTR